VSDSIDSRTGRKLGDHGEALHAINYSLDHIDDFYEADSFLKDWREGAAFENWPEYYTWLKEQEA